MMEASEEAEEDEVPGDVCSVKMVVPWAMHALKNESVPPRPWNHADTYYSSWADCPELEAMA